MQAPDQAGLLNSQSKLSKHTLHQTPGKSAQVDLQIIRVMEHYWD